MDQIDCVIDITDLIVENPVRQRGASRLSVSRMAPSRVDSEKSQIDFEVGKTAQCTSIVNSADVIIVLPVKGERICCLLVWHPLVSAGFRIQSY